LADYVTFRGGRLPASPWYCIYSGTRAGVLTLFRLVYSNSSLIKPRSGCCGLRSVHVRSKNLPYSTTDVRRIVSNCKICAEVKPWFYRLQEGSLIKAMHVAEQLHCLLHLKELKITKTELKRQLKDC